MAAPRKQGTGALSSVGNRVTGKHGKSGSSVKSRGGLTANARPSRVLKRGGDSL